MFPKRKLDEYVGLDEYMSTVAEEGNDFDHDDDNERAVKQVKDAPEVANRVSNGHGHG